MSQRLGAVPGHLIWCEGVNVMTECIQKWVDSEGLADYSQVDTLGMWYKIRQLWSDSFNPFLEIRN